MKKYNYIVSVVMLLLSGYIFYESSGYTIGSSAQKNPAVWPCILAGALTMQGIVFGPSLFTEEPGKAYIVFIALFVANILMGICGFSMIRVFGKVIDVPSKYLVPVIMTFCITGTFALNHYLEEVFLMLIMGVIGFVLILSLIHISEPTRPY